MSGLRNALDVLPGVAGVAFTHFDAGDVVRHPLVQRIVRAYEAAGSGMNRRGALIVDCRVPARVRAPSRRLMARWADAALGARGTGHEMAAAGGVGAAHAGAEPPATAARTNPPMCWRFPPRPRPACDRGRWATW